MSEDLVQAMDGLLDRLVAVLAGQGTEGEPTVGAAADGLITASLGPDGRVQALTADPSLLRHRDRIAPGLLAAVNQAARARPEPEPRSRTAEELAAIQQDSLDLTKAMSSSLVAAIEGLKEAQRR
jgi:hypothetical protein